MNGWVWGKGNVTADRDVIFQMVLENPGIVLKLFLTTLTFDSRMRFPEAAR
jgi:hypothetical protein